MVQTNEIVAKLKLDDKDFQSKIGNVGKAALAVSASIVGTGAAFLYLADQIAKTESEMAKMAAGAGMTVEAFSALTGAAELAGVEQEKLIKVSEKLASANADTLASFKDIGVSVKDASGKMKTADVLLGDVANKISKMKSPADQAAAAIHAFGGEGKDLLPMLKLGKEGIKKLTDEAEAMGLVVTQKAAVAAEEYTKKMREVGQAAKGLSMAVGESIIQFINQSGAGNIAKDAIMGITQAWKGLSEDTRKTIITFGAAAVGVGLFIIALLGIVKVAPIIFAALTMATGGLNLLIIGIAAAVAALTILAVGTYKYWSQIKAGVQPAIDSIKQFGKGIVELGAIMFGPIIGAIKDIGNFFTKLSDNSAKGAGEVSYFGTAVNVAMKVVAFAFVAAITPINLMIDVIVALVKTLSQAGSALKAVFTGNFKGAGAAATAAWGEIKNGASNVQKDVQKFRDSMEGMFRDNIVMKIDSKQADKAKEDANALSRAFGGVAVSYNELQQAMINFYQAKIDAEKRANGGKDSKESAKLEKELEALKKGYTKANQDLEKNVAALKIVELYAQKFGEVAKIAGDMTAVIAENIKFNAQVADRDAEVALNKYKKEMAEKIAATQAGFEEQRAATAKAFDDEIAALQAQEDYKRNILESSLNEQLLLQDEAYQKARALREAEYEKQIEDLRANFDEQQELIEQNSEDKEEEHFAISENEADFRLTMQNMERQHQADMTNFDKEYGDQRKNNEAVNKAQVEKLNNDSAEKIKALTEAKNAALKKSETDQNAALQAMQKEQGEKEEAMQKDRTRKQWEAEVSAYEATKATKIAETIATGIAGAAQAWASLSAIPFVGFALGAAAAGVILATTAMRVDQISSQAPIKPASIMAQGGFLGGNVTHGSGGLALNAESGEVMIKKDKTAQLYDYIDSLSETGSMGRAPITIYLTLNTTEPLSERTLNQVSYSLAQRLRKEIPQI